MRGNEDRIVDLLCWHNIHDRAFMAPCGMDLLTHTWCRSPRRPYFLCLCKESRQRNTPQAARPALRSGSASGPGIFVRHIHVPYGNAVIHDGALRVLPGPLAAPHGDPKATSTAKTRADPSGTALGPLRSGSHGGRNPAGAAHRDVRRFRPGQDALSENSRRDCAPAARGGRTVGVCFFCLLFFAQAKKSRAPAASGTMSDTIED